MIRAWHFVGDTLRDGRPVPPDGEWLEHAGPLKLCESGLHASRDPLDALQYAPGPVLCLVECDGTILEAGDKLVCSRRRVVRRVDMTPHLQAFARERALSVVHLWDAPKAVTDYLTTGADAPRAAAWTAAWIAAKAAEYATTRAAACAAFAACDARFDAARAAAWATMSAASTNADPIAAYAAPRAALNKIVHGLFA